MQRKWSSVIDSIEDAEIWQIKHHELTFRHLVNTTLARRSLYPLIL